METPKTAREISKKVYAPGLHAVRTAGSTAADVDDRSEREPAYTRAVASGEPIDYAAPDMSAEDLLSKAEKHRLAAVQAMEDIAGYSGTDYTNRGITQLISNIITAVKLEITAEIVREFEQITEPGKGGE